MTTITAPAPLVRLSAPLPLPRKYTLLDAAQDVPPANDRWLAGAHIEGYPPGPTHTHDPCSSGTDRVKAAARVIATPMHGAFTVYLLGECTSRSIGPDPGHWEDRLQLAFQALEAAAVERVLATGDGHSTLGPYLTDPNLDVLTAAAVSPVEGLALLETVLAERVGGGIIHASPATATYWQSEHLLDTVGGQKVTGLGTRVAVGAGYVGADPGTGLAAGHDWAFATGPIQITRDPTPTVIPADYAQALDRNNNDVVFIAERNYLINTVLRQSPADDENVQAGVLIDRTT